MSIHGIIYEVRYLLWSAFRKDHRAERRAKHEAWFLWFGLACMAFFGLIGNFNAAWSIGVTSILASTVGVLVVDALMLTRVRHVMRRVRRQEPPMSGEMSKHYEELGRLIDEDIKSLREARYRSRRHIK